MLYTVVKTSPINKPIDNGRFLAHASTTCARDAHKWSCLTAQPPAWPTVAIRKSTRFLPRVIYYSFGLLSWKSVAVKCVRFSVQYSHGRCWKYVSSRDPIPCSIHMLGSFTGGKYPEVSIAPSNKTIFECCKNPHVFIAPLGDLHLDYSKQGV